MLALWDGSFDTGIDDLDRHHRGFREVARLETRVEDQRQLNDDLLQRNAELQAEVEDLRERLDAVEERARNELGLIKPDEQFYQVVPPPPGTSETVKNDGEST